MYCWNTSNDMICSSCFVGTIEEHMPVPSTNETIVMGVMWNS